MCAHSNTVKVKIGDREIPVDRCMSQIVWALNAGGVDTSMSCCGHGEHDGFILLHHEDEYRLLIVCPPGAESQRRFTMDFQPMAEENDNRRLIHGR